MSADTEEPYDPMQNVDLDDESSYSEKNNDSVSEPESTIEPVKPSGEPIVSDVEVEEIPDDTEKRGWFGRKKSDNSIDGADDRLSDITNSSILATRRLMAWICIASVLIMVGLLFFYVPYDKVGVYDTIFNSFLFFAGSVVLTYMGSSVATTFLANYPMQKGKK